MHPRWGRPADPFVPGFPARFDRLCLVHQYSDRQSRSPRTRGFDWQVNANGFPFLGKNILHVNLSGTRLLGPDIQLIPISRDRLRGQLRRALRQHYSTHRHDPDWKLFNRVELEPTDRSPSHSTPLFFIDHYRSVHAESALDQPAPPNIPIHAASGFSRGHYFDASGGFDIGSAFQLTFGVNNLTE